MSLWDINAYEVEKRLPEGALYRSRRVDIDSPHANQFVVNIERIAGPGYHETVFNSREELLLGIPKIMSNMHKLGMIDEKRYGGEATKKMMEQLMA